MTSGAVNQGMRTQNNFYNRKNLVEEDKSQPLNPPVVNPHQMIPQGGNIYDQQHINYAGDRVPTRER